ncbi:MAG: hypothetical protein Q9214_001641 [Letrouitia sp. 1 TL-2023]
MAPSMNGKSKKRKQSDMASDDNNINADAKNQSSSEKKTPIAGRLKQTAKSARLTNIWAKSIEKGLPPPGAPPVGYHITPNGRLASDVHGSEPSFIQGIKPKAGRKERESKMEPSTKRQRAMTESKTKSKGPSIERDSKSKGEANVQIEPKAKNKSKAKQTTSSRPSTTSSAASSLALINGMYRITCPTIEQEWPSIIPDEGLTLALALEKDTVWGAYDFGMFSGIIRLAQRPTSATSTSVPFKWRGRENGEGEMSFGDRCQGHIKFLEKGKIEGRINVYGDATFQGKRRGAPGRTAKDMREEWETYNKDAYERERVGRWG